MGTATTPRCSQQKKSPCRRALLATALLLAGCADPAEECKARFQERAYEEAAAVCGRAFRERGAPEAATRAASAAYELGRAGEVRDWGERLRGQRGEAEVLFYVARLELRAGDHEAARATHRRALALARERGEPVATARNALALALEARRQGAYAEALNLAYESLAAAQDAGDRERQSRAMEITGQILYDLGDLDGARMAQSELRGIADPADTALQARLAQQQGVLYEAEERLSLARDAFARSLALAEVAGDQNLRHGNLVNLASVSISLGESEPARRHLADLDALAPQFSTLTTPLYRGRLARQEGRLDEAARVLAEGLARSNSHEWLWELELEAGQVAELRGDGAAAEAAYARAVEIVEKLRSNLASNELKAWALARKRRPYEALFALYARQARTRDALGVLERARARSLLDALVARTEASAPAGDGGGTTPGEPPPWMRAAAERADAIALLLPAMSSAPGVEPRPVDEVMHALGTRTALVYFRTADALWVVHVGAGRVTPIELATGAEARALDAQIESLARAPGDMQAATALGSALLPEALLPPPGSTLLIAADGPLLRLPFAVLRIGGQHLVERHALVHVPGLGALAAIEAQARSASAPPAAIGDPRGDLPEAARELAHVAEMLGGRAYAGPAATTEALRGAARARLLHLATHVEVGPRGANLILADGAADTAEIVIWQLAPDLAVLAGCASAAQLAHRHGRETWGSLAAAFLASGARQVVAALWSIPDGPARTFVERFYAEGGANDPAGALARTQRAWIADGRAAEEWAPFVLLGTDAPAAGRP